MELWTLEDQLSLFDYLLAYFVFKNNISIEKENDSNEDHRVAIVHASG
jgi:hypothetical protein